MFDQLSARLEKVMKFLRGEGKITEKNLVEALGGTIGASSRPGEGTEMRIELPVRGPVEPSP